MNVSHPWETKRNRRTQKPRFGLCVCSNYWVCKPVLYPNFPVITREKVRKLVNLFLVNLNLFTLKYVILSWFMSHSTRFGFTSGHWVTATRGDKYTPYPRRYNAVFRCWLQLFPLYDRHRDSKTKDSGGIEEGLCGSRMYRRLDRFALDNRDRTVAQRLTPVHEETVPAATPD